MKGKNGFDSVPRRWLCTVIEERGQDHTAETINIRFLKRYRQRQRKKNLMTAVDKVFHLNALFLSTMCNVLLCE